MSRPVPRGWGLATVGDVVLPVGTVDPQTLSDETFDYIDIGSINNQTGVVEASRRTNRSAAPSRARMAVRAGDILFSTVRPYLRAIAPVPALTFPIASTGFCVLRPAEGVDARYLFHWVRSNEFIESVLPLQRGSSYPAVRDAAVLGLPVPLPPRCEQSRIAEALDESLINLQEGCDELAAAQRKLNLYRQSLLKSAVDGSLTAEWRSDTDQGDTGADLLSRITRRREKLWRGARRGEYQVAPAVGTEAPFDAPRSWTWTTLGTLIQTANYGTSVKCSADGANVAVLRIPNIQASAISLDDIKFSTEPLDLSGSEYLRSGDVLVVRTNGSVSLVGSAASIPRPGLPGRYYYASYLLRLRPVLPRMMGPWIDVWLRSPPARRIIESMAASSAGQHNIGLSALLRVPIPLPTLREQSEALRVLSELLSKTSGQEKAIDRALAMAAAQRQNILRAAFSGRLVPQDPNDEPASVLLERIRMQREAAPPSKPRRTRRTAPTASA